MAEILTELLKCRCLCVKCHQEEHANGRRSILENQIALFVGSGEAWSVN